MQAGSRKANKVPGSASLRKESPLGKAHAPKTSKDGGVTESKDGAEAEKLGDGENTIKSDTTKGDTGSGALGSVAGDEDKIKRVDGEVLVGEKIVVEGEPTGASNSSYLSSTPTVTVQAPTPTPTTHTNEKDEAALKLSDPQSSREAGTSTEDDVDMHDVDAEGYDGPGKKKHPELKIQLPPSPHAEESARESEGGDMPAGEQGEGEGSLQDNHGTGLVQTPTADERQTWLLPPLAPQFEGKKCLVLDLDETLVHSSFKVWP